MRAQKGAEKSSATRAVLTNPQLLAAPPPWRYRYSVPMIHRPRPGGSHLNAHMRR